MLKWINHHNNREGSPVSMFSCKANNDTDKSTTMAFFTYPLTWKLLLRRQREQDKEGGTALFPNWKEPQNQIHSIQMD